MGRTSVIMGFFCISVTTFSILENQQHVSRQMHTEAPVVARTEVLPESIESEQPYISDEVCCNEVEYAVGSYSDLKRELNNEDKQLEKLRDMQAAVDKELQTAYQKTETIKQISKVYGIQKTDKQLSDAREAVSSALQNWVQHDAQIDHLAKLNSRYRLHYLPESQKGYKLNQRLTKERRAKDSIRTATDLRIQYLNEMYRRQNWHLRQRINPALRSKVAAMPVYH